MKRDFLQRKRKMIRINDYILNPTIFPDKTSQVWKLPNHLLSDSIIVIEWAFESESEFLHIVQALDLLRSFDHKLENGRKIRLYIPYMPYARQDKERCNESTFAGLTFVELLNLLNVNEISTVDVHNPKIYENLKGFKNYTCESIIKDIIRYENINVVVFPDKGAKDRYWKFIPEDMIVIHGEKVRDQSTGDINSLRLSGDARWVYGRAKGLNFRYLVLDDIFDGGASPVRTALCLNLSLKDYLVGYFSHCLCTKGTDIIKNAGYKKLYDYRGLFIDFEK
jgi:ribose-phosphate pyrophosphokinase